MKSLFDKEDILVEQPRLGMGLYITTILVMMAVQWMTLDMYLPALPVLKEEFGVSEAVLNFSLNSDLILCAIGSLIGGTISDKYGRNPVLLTGLLMCAAALFACAMANNVWVLTLMRGISGLGGGFALTVSNAICRDSFKGRSFQKIMTFSQASAIIGPLFAPALGAFFLEFLSWRWIFIFLGTVTLITAIPFFFAAETWPKERRQVDSVWKATVQTFEIAKKRDYLIFMSLVLLLTIPMWVYLGVCSYIFYDEFGVTNLQYSVLYACGTVVSFAAPFIYITLSKWMANRWIVDVCMLLLLATVVLLAVAAKGPILFLIAAMPVMCAEGIIRPMCMVVVLEEYPQEAGSASAVTHFALIAVGVLATAVATLQWSTFLFGMTMITAASLAAAILVWIVMLRRKLYARQLGLRS